MTPTLFIASGDQPPIAPRRRWPGWVTDWLLVLCVCGLTLMLGLGTPDFWSSVRTAAERTLVASVRTWLALGLFFSIAWLLYRGLVRLFLAAGARTERVLLAIAWLLLLVLAINAFPIAVYIYWFKDLGLPVELNTWFSLLLANALLYYFFNRFFRMLWRESHRLYAVSAWFKGSTPVAYTREEVHWALLNDLKPIFLYILSFTLFTDYLLDVDRPLGIGDAGFAVMGIIGVLFRDVFTDGWTLHVWVAVLVLWLLLWPQRWLLDRFARVWERRHRVGATSPGEA